MRIFKIFCAVFAIGLLITFLGIYSCYAQSASEKDTPSTILSESQMANEMNEIREKRNKALSAYNNLSKKAKDAKTANFLEEINQKIDKQNALAEKLERNGDYKNAAKCYKTIFKLVQSRRLKSFIAKENRKLKLRAAKEKIAAKQMISKKRRAISDKKKGTEIDARKKKTSKKSDRVKKDVVKKLEERVVMLEAKLQAKAAENALAPIIEKAVENVPSLTASVEGPVVPKDVAVEIEVAQEVPETEKIPQADENVEKTINDAEYLIENADMYFDKLDYEKAYQIYKEALLNIEKASIKDK